MNFSLEHALANANAVIVRRKARQSGGVKYRLYFSNNGKHPEGSITGLTQRGLKKEFFDTHGTYKYAFITKDGDSKVMQCFVRGYSKKFFDPRPRTGKKSK